MIIAECELCCLCYDIIFLPLFYALFYAVITFRLCRGSVAVLRPCAVATSSIIRLAVSSSSSSVSVAVIWCWVLYGSGSTKYLGTT